MSKTVLDVRTEIKKVSLDFSFSVLNTTLEATHNNVRISEMSTGMTDGLSQGTSATFNWVQHLLNNPPPSPPPKVSNKRKAKSTSDDNIIQESANTSIVTAAPKKKRKTTKPKEPKVAKEKVVHVETLHRIANVLPTPDELAALKKQLTELTGDPLKQSKIWKQHVAKYSVIDGKYSIPTSLFDLGMSHLSDRKVKEMLTFNIESFGGENKPGDAAAGASGSVRICYQEDGSWLRIPRALGIDLYGIPASDQTSLGEPMNPDLVFVGEISETELRPQQSANKAVLEQLKKCYSGVLTMCCGSGKSRTTAYTCLKLGRKTLWVAHLSSLLIQAKKTFEDNIPGVRVGWIQEDRCEVEGMDVVMASSQTLLSRKFSDEFRAQFGTVIVDEVHHISSPQYSTISGRFCAHNVIGLSATPRRRDGTTDLIFYLVGKIAFQCERPPQTVHVHCINYNNKKNEKEIKTKNKNYAYTLLKKRLMYDWKRTNVIVDQIIKHSLEGRRIIVFTDYHDHMDILIQSLERRTKNWKKPLDVVEYSGRIKTKEREEKLSHDILITSPSMMKEGVDAVGFDTVIFGYLQGDPEQSSGRILRTEIENMENIPKLIYLKESFGILQGLANKNWRYFSKLGYTFTYETVDVKQDSDEDDESEDDDDEKQEPTQKRSEKATGPGKRNAARNAMTVVSDNKSGCFF